MTTATSRKSPKSSPLDTRLFLFTPAEERAIRRAVRSSVKFMQSFGQAPAQPPIDLTHYLNTEKFKWYDEK